MALNSDQTLIWLDKYFDKKFGTFGTNTCLLTAIGRILIKEVGVSQVTFSAVMKAYPTSMLRTLENILNAVNRPWSVGKNLVDVRMSVFLLKKKQQVIDELRNNRPSILVYDGWGPVTYAVQDVEHMDRSGFKPEGKIKPEYSPSYNLTNALNSRGYMTAHAVLIVGYDVAEDYFICRDSNHTYSLKGYYKVKPDDAFKLGKFIGVNVESQVQEEYMSFKKYVDNQQVLS